MAGILIVDDDPTIRTMFARALKPLGDIEQASNGAEALRLLGSKRYGIVLLDLHMLVIDGFILLHTLSNKPGPNKDTPIFVITADNSEQARLKALRRHAVFLLTKPVPIATLTALVESALKKSAARAGLGDDGTLDLDVNLPVPPTSPREKLPSLSEISLAPSTPRPPGPAAPAGSTGRMTPPVRPFTTGEPPKPPTQPFTAGGPKKPGT